MKYIATALGFDGSALRQPGEVFDAPADFPPGEWFTAYKAPKRGAAAPVDEGEGGENSAPQ